jgi:hypothetical protein
MKKRKIVTIHKKYGTNKRIININDNMKPKKNTTRKKFMNKINR